MKSFILSRKVGTTGRISNLLMQDLKVLGEFISKGITFNITAKVAMIN
ncbi:hypothetical protein CLV42_11857 [Chitinophaga ginsengisoli]|uniref:Uncharacterized protein n=1 Tax=Chitinophaga ginsengisoli TaxID=363837 RepID=A0A2P8FNN4_9BACT|nr:hypothetical protein CLV42_11857 [Chitinophaga ginsengisoli]